MPRTFTSAGPSALIAIAVATAGCGIVGPSCLERQQRGTVASLAGHVEAGQVASHAVTYDLQGSQNDVNISWAGQGSVEGPRLRVYATASSCAEFVPPDVNDTTDADRGVCTIIARCGGSLAPDARPCARDNSCQPTPDEIICRSLTVTGPGNGAPADFRDYKLHIVGDAKQGSTYSVTVTWFFGPDC